ncbi:MAG: histone deacetylase family protein [Bacteroidetes bacterium]|nr:histone deacetylase family protein [Bacteroidota bacterium]
MRILFISHAEFTLHDPGPLHPECPRRMHAINDELIASRLSDVMDFMEAIPATREQLEAVHTGKYIDAIEALNPSSGVVKIDGDTIMSPGTWNAAVLAAGAVVLGVDQSLSGEHPRVFCSVRPPGHHAEHERGMGFCFLNNVAVGAAHALDQHGLERIAILDFDVHHGNGTEDIFSDDTRVLYCSTFQYPLFPFTGIEFVAPNVINSPLPAGLDGEGYRKVVAEEWLPRLDEFKPQLVLVSAGFDAHEHDDLGGLRLHTEDFDWIAERIVEVAEKHSEGRIVSVLEGGYNLPVLGRSVATYLRALM